MATGDDDHNPFDSAQTPTQRWAQKDGRKIVGDQRAACGNCGSVGLCKKMHMAHIYDGHTTWTYVCDRRCNHELHRRHHHPRDRSDRVVFEPEPDDIVDQN